ncbi:MAG: phosphatase PAP2 family protein [Bacteroidota bacterium]
MYLAKITIAFFFLFLLVATHTNAQFKDSTNTKNRIDAITPQLNWRLTQQKQSFKIKPYVIPAFMIVYGFTAIENDGLQNLNTEFKDEVYQEYPHKKTSVDNYLQFAPAATVYGLDAFGVKAKHNLRDRTMIFLISNIITNASVYSIKTLSHQLRPDGSKYNSFPSGHTAEAFANAEFLRQEYKNVSPWYGVVGYAMAATTGYLRMYNNKHSLSDVVAGAGVGIISTKLTYWLYPKIQHKLFKDKLVNTMIMPAYQNGSFGMGMVHRFKKNSIFHYCKLKLG